VIVPDVNLLVHAYNQDSPQHPKARAWFERLMSGTDHVGLAWAAILGFIRITTNRHVSTNPMPVILACDHVRSWLAQPHVSLIHPGDRHAEILFGFFATLGSAGNLTTDAHLAALTVEHQSELCSTDSDFARFPGLRWTNPLK